VQTPTREDPLGYLLGCWQEAETTDASDCFVRVDAVKELRERNVHLGHLPFLFWVPRNPVRPTA
jgi:hypothetical protein